MPGSTSRIGRARDIGFLTFLGLVFLTGGSSFPDHPPLLLLRPVSAAFLAFFLLTRRQGQGARLRILVMLLAALAAIIAVQLVPLPSAVWLAMPGHDRFAEVAAIVGGGWRPLSLDPDLTINSLMALLPVAAALAGYAALPQAGRRRLLGALIVAAIASAALGVIQLAAGPTSPAYFFPRMTRFLPVGLLGNQNHQALLLAVSLPMLAAWLRLDMPRHFPKPAIYGAAAAIALLNAALVMMTRSRTGALLLVFAAICAAIILYAPGRREDTRSPATRRAITVLLPATVLSAGALTWWAGRDSSFDRLFGQVEELRFRAWPVVIDMIGRYFPFGTGFGAFDVAYRIDEPDALLHPQYFNRAHNDLLELVLSGGAGAAVLLIAFLAWLAVRAFVLWRGGGHGDWRLRQAAAGVVVAATLALSLTDYPLRTPSVAVLFTIMLCWLCEPADLDDSAPPSVRLP